WSFTASVPASSFSFRDTFRYAGWPQYGSELARSFRDRTPPGRQLSSDYLSGSETAARRDRKGSVRLVRNRAGRSEIRVWRSLPRFGGLVPVICMRGFLPRALSRVLPGACKPTRRCPPPGFAGVLRAIGFHSRTGVKRKR